LIVGGLTEIFVGLDSERKPLEGIATPLTALTVKGGEGAPPRRVAAT
jgi:hypothetical protein